MLYYRLYFQPAMDLVKQEIKWKLLLLNDFYDKLIVNSVKYARVVVLQSCFYSLLEQTESIHQKLVW